MSKKDKVRGNDDSDDSDEDNGNGKKQKTKTVLKRKDPGKHNKYSA